MVQILYTLSGKVHNENHEPVNDKLVIFLYKSLEFIRFTTDKDGYFSYTGDKLENMYKDPDLFKRLKVKIDNYKIISIEIKSKVTPTLFGNGNEVKAIKVHITVSENKDTEGHAKDIPK